MHGAIPAGTPTHWPNAPAPSPSTSRGASAAIQTRGSTQRKAAYSPITFTLGTCLLTLALPKLAIAASALPMETAPTLIESQRLPLPLHLEMDLRHEPARPTSDAGAYLSTLPGFSIVRSGGTNSDPVLRGLFGSRLNLRGEGGVMLGGCGSRMDAPSAYITPATFDRVTVIKGPQSVQWGPGGSAGTVLFEREPPVFHTIGTSLHARLTSGSNQRREQTLDGIVGEERGYLRLMDDHSRSGDYRDGGGQRVPSRWSKWNSDATLGWTPDADTRVELSAGRGDGEARLGGRGMDVTRMARGSYSVRLDKHYPDATLERVQAQAFYNQADHVMDNFRLRHLTGAQAVPSATQVGRQTAGARLAATWAFDEFEWITGLDAQRSAHRLRKSSHRRDTQGYVPPHASAWRRDAIEHNVGLFAEGTWYAASDQRLVGGARFDHAWARDLRSTHEQRRHATLPSGFLRYEQDLADIPVTLYAGLGHTQRNPDYWELFSGGRGPRERGSAFTELNPERTTQLDVGARYQGEKAQAWISAYIGRVDDFILFDYTGSSRYSTNVDALTMGAELGGTWWLTPRWQAEASLAHAQGHNRSDRQPLPQMPSLQTRLGLNYHVNESHVGVHWRAASAQHRVAPGKGTVAGRDFSNSAGFGVLSLVGHYRFSDELTMDAGIDNLLNKRYAEHLNQAGNASFGLPANRPLNEPGRTVWSTLTVSF